MRTLKTFVATLVLTLSAGVALADAGSPAATAERLRNDARTSENRGDTQRAKDANRAADHAAQSSRDHARETERDHNRGVDHDAHDHNNK